jgi:hypothetical protein
VSLSHRGLGSLGDPLGLSGGIGTNLPSAPIPNPNLLLQTEELDSAGWSKTSTIVLANQDSGPSGPANTSDEVSSTGASAAISQTSGTAATAGSAATSATVLSTGVYVRGVVTGTFDGSPYTFSIYLKDTGNALVPFALLRIDRLGGFIRCSVEDAAGDADYMAWGAQLEAGSSASTYQHRGGT